MFRRLGYAFFSFLLPVALLTSTFMLSIFMVLGTPKYIEEALDKSGVYDVAVDSALAEAKDDGKAGDDIPLSDPAVQDIIKKTVPPARLQAMAENIINGTYFWIQGRTDKPTFSVDITQLKAELANNVGAYVLQRLNGLPTCAKGVSVAGIDPYTTTCVPKGYDSTIASQAITNQIIGSTDFLDQGVYTVDDIKTEQGSPSIDEYKAVPMAYQAFQVSIWVNSFAALAAAIAIVFLAATKRRGLKRIGVVAIVAGILLLLVAWGSTRGIDKLSVEVGKDSGSQALQRSATEAFSMLGGHLCKWWLWEGIILTIVGVGLLVWLRLSKHEDDAATAEPTKGPKESLEKLAPIPAIPKAPKPKPKAPKK